MQFGDRLRLLRDEKGITQMALGKVLNISGRVIGYYEANDRFPKDENTLRKIAEYFDVSVDWLVGLSNSRTKVKYENKDFYELYVSELPDEAKEQVYEFAKYMKQKYATVDSAKKQKK